MQVTDKTKQLASDILEYWSYSPENLHDQGSWVALDESELRFKTKKVKDKEVNICNSTMCAAGTAVFLSTSLKEFKGKVSLYSGDEWSIEGAELLGLNDDEAYWLFTETKDEEAREAMKFVAAGDPQGFARYRGTL